MVVDKLALFERTRALWPPVIELSGDPDATNKIYWANEAAQSVGDHWLQIAMWAFHQALSELEGKAFAAGVSTISTREIEFSAFDACMRANLNGDEGWSDERAAWAAVS